MSKPAQPTRKEHLLRQIMQTDWYGHPVDDNTPDGITAIMVARGDRAVGSIPAYRGEDGRPGANAVIWDWQYQDELADPSELPANLGNTDQDIGKGWAIGELFHVWAGPYGWKTYPISGEGKPGPVPVIEPTVELLDPYGPDQSTVLTSGPDENPSWHIRLKIPPGPPGDNSRIRESFDYQEPVGDPTDGQVIAYNAAAKKYEPRDPNAKGVEVWGVPQTAFQRIPISIGTEQQIGAFTLPPRSDGLPYKLICTGKIWASGFDLGLTPFAMRCLVRLGSPQGVVVAEGEGGNIGAIDLFPKWESTALTPNNEVCRIAANTEAKLFFSLKNDGLVGMFEFDPAKARVMLQTIPT